MLRAKTIPPTCRWMKSNTVCLTRDNLLVLCACFFAFCYFQAILSSRYWHLTFILASNITKAIITKNTILSCLDHRLMANENALPLSNIIFRKHIFSRYPVLEHRSVFLHLERCEKGFFYWFFYVVQFVKNTKWLSYNFQWKYAICMFLCVFRSGAYWIRLSHLT